MTKKTFLLTLAVVAALVTDAFAQKTCAQLIAEGEEKVRQAERAGRPDIAIQQRGILQAVKEICEDPSLPTPPSSTFTPDEPIQPRTRFIDQCSGTLWEATPKRSVSAERYGWNAVNRGWKWVHPWTSITVTNHRSVKIRVYYEMFDGPLNQLRTEVSAGQTLFAASIDYRRVLPEEQWGYLVLDPGERETLGVAYVTHDGRSLTVVVSRWEEITKRSDWRETPTAHPCMTSATRRLVFGR